MTRQWITDLVERVETEDRRINSSSDKGAMGLALGRDTNGNKTLKVSFTNANGFSVQTNQNLPLTHRMTSDHFDYKAAAEELRNHIKRFGTRRQRDITGWSL